MACFRNDLVPKLLKCQTLEYQTTCNLSTWPFQPLSPSFLPASLNTPKLPVSLPLSVHCLDKHVYCPNTICTAHLRSWSCSRLAVGGTPLGKKRGLTGGRVKVRPHGRTLRRTNTVTLSYRVAGWSGRILKITLFILLKYRSSCKQVKSFFLYL